MAPFPLLAWAPGGQSLIVVDRGAPNEPLGLFVLSTATGEKRRLTNAPSGYIGDGAPSVATDGRSLLFSRAARISESALYQLPLTASLAPGGEPRRLTSLKDWTANPSWLPGAREVLFARGSTYLGPFGLWRMPVSGKTPPRRVAVVGNCGGPAFSPMAGRLAFSYSISNSNIWRVPLGNTRAAGAPQRFIASTREDEVPQYSPDGSRIVFTSNRSGVHEVWISNADASGPVQLTAFGTGMTGSPKWSPDSKKIVFDGNAEGQFRVYTINASGGTPLPLTRDTVEDALGAFSPDGQRIYFSSGRAGIRQIFYVSTGGGEPVQLTHNGGTNPTVAPTGSLVYFWRANKLWAVPAGGGPETLVLNSVSLFKYAVGAHGIYFVPLCGDTVCEEIDYFDLSSRAAHRVLATDGRVGSGLTVSPDEKFLLYTRIEQTDSDLMLIEKFR
jgi:Tol biopolymer transport system component